MNREDLITGAVYEVAALDFSVGIWTGQEFKGPKREYGNLFFGYEYPYWDGLPRGTAKPIRRLGDKVIQKPYDGINLLRILEILNDLILEEEKDL